jgi:(p)ppGpp synthase/HD superfamily hydrolase
MLIVLEAIKFANIKHAGQTRKGSGDPYVTHPIAVSYLVAAYKRSKVLMLLLVAAILHDVYEDTDTTLEEIEAKFGAFVASLVKELSDDPEEKKLLGKLEYQKRKLLRLSSYALLLKLCDRLHNISDQPSAQMIHDTLELLDHLVANRKLTRPQVALVGDIRTACREAVS